MKKAIADKKKVLGRAHVDTLSTMNNLADLLDRHGEPDAALPLFEEAFEGFRAWSRGRSSNTARTGAGVRAARIVGMPRGG